MEVKRLGKVNKDSYMIPIKDGIATRETSVVNFEGVYEEAALNNSCGIL
jgi:hypothetical protein